MAIVPPGQDKHRVLAMASSRTFGLDAGEQETSYGLPYEPVNLGAGSVYKIFTTATALQKGLGINYQIDRAAVRVRLPDLRRRQRAADPGAERGRTTPERLSLHGRAGASRRTPRSSSSRSSPASRTWSTWRCGWA